MKIVGIDSVEPGQVLGKTIFSSAGAVLLAEGVQLTVYMITTLRRLGVTMLYIKDPRFEDADIAEVVSEENKRLVMQKMGEMMEAIRSGKQFDSRALSVSIDRLLDDIMQNKEVLVQLTDIRTHDNEAFIHALNVCTMAVMMGINMGLNQLQLKELAIGSLLHDIGKLDPNTDDDSNDPKRHHAWRGFDLLKSKRELSLLIAHTAFQHHEQIDGQGEPRQLDGSRIHPYAKITAVANTYDRLLYDPETGNRMLPHEACEYMMALAGTKLDLDTVIQFLRTVSVYPTGTSVRLSTHETGVVVGQHRGLPGRPVVRIITRDADYYEAKEIDLAREATVFIEGVLS